METDQNFIVTYVKVHLMESVILCSMCRVVNLNTLHYKMDKLVDYLLGNATDFL